MRHPGQQDDEVFVGMMARAGFERFCWWKTKRISLMIYPSDWAGRTVDERDPLLPFPVFAKRAEVLASPLAYLFPELRDPAHA